MTVHRLPPNADQRVTPPMQHRLAVDDDLVDAVAWQLIEVKPSITVNEVVWRAAAVADLLRSRGLIVTRPVNELQKRAAAWRHHRFPESTPTDVIAKLTEEVGELARAVIGDIEHRPNRGDVGQEAAQVVLVVLAMIGRFYPAKDVLESVRAELERLGA